MPNRQCMRKNLIRSFAVALGLSVSAFAMGATEALAGAQVGTSAAVQGNVFVRGGSSGEQRRAQVRQSINLDDRVLTKQESALQILLLDRSIFTVGENCEMVIDRFVYDPDTGNGEMAASVVKGAFRFMSGQIGGSNPTSVTIDTPSATIGIRGTFIESIIGDDAASLADQMGIEYSSDCGTSQAGLYILRGPGLGTNTLEDTGIMDVSTSGGSATATDANYAIFVPCPGAEPIGPFPVPDHILQYLDYFLRSAPNGPGVNPTGETESGEEFAGQSQFNEGIGDPPPGDPPQGQFDPNIPMMPPIYEC